MAIKKGRLSQAQITQARRLRRDIIAAIRSPHFFPPNLGLFKDGIDKLKKDLSSWANYGSIACKVLDSLDDAAFVGSKAQVADVAYAVVGAIEARLMNNSEIVVNDKENLDRQSERIAEIESACSRLETILKRFGRIRHEDIDKLLHSARIQEESGIDQATLKKAAEIRDILSTPEIKALILKFGSFEKMTLALLDILPGVALYGQIPWMNDQDTFVMEAEDNVLRAWVPLSNIAFGKSNWDLLSAILSSKHLKGSSALKTTRGALKNRASKLGLA